MICGYCAADSESGEPHTIECEVYRILNDNPEARADPYSAYVTSLVALHEFIRLNDAKNMSDKEYHITVAIADKLIELDPHTDPMFDRSTL